MAGPSGKHSAGPSSPAQPALGVHQLTVRGVDFSDCFEEAALREANQTRPK